MALKPGLNILYGKNGTGKTTILHILANLLDRDVTRFNNLRFRLIRVTTEAGCIVEIRPLGKGPNAAVTVRVDGESFPPLTRGSPTPPEIRELLKYRLGGRPVYLPAFRSVLEAISHDRSYIAEQQRNVEFGQILRQEEEESAEERGFPPFIARERSRAAAHKTLLCRDWFGPFVPVVRFPSLWEVSEELTSELQQAQLAVGATDREAFSGVFVQVLRGILAPSDTSHPGNVEGLLSSIRESLTQLEQVEAGSPEVYSQIASMVRDPGKYPSHEERIATRILQVYDSALKARSAGQKKAFEQIRTFEHSVNRFLTGKRLSTQGLDYRVHRQHRRSALIQTTDGRRSGLSVLSSGERHVLTLLFSATHMSATDGMLLIDEPELSLHVGWQRLILDEMMKQAGTRQILACTHAPEVAAKHRDVMTRLVPTETSEESSSAAELELNLGGESI